VAAVFARHGLSVQVDTAGSREIATRVDLVGCAAGLAGLSSTSPAW
jgi:hypothetical protein